MQVSREIVESLKGEGEVNTLKKSQIIENIPFRYCAQVLALLNVRSTPSFPQSEKEVLRLLNQKITREEAIYLHRQWKRGFSPMHTAGCLKKPDGVAASVLVSMNLRQKGFNVQTEVLLNGRQCDVVAFKSESADEIWAIELKSPRDVWQRGINQCEEYALWSDKPLLAVMGLTKDVLMSRTADSYVGIARVGNTGDFEIVKEPTWKFQCTNQSFAIFTVCELKKMIQFIEGKCPKHNKKGLIDLLFQSTGDEELERIFRIFFAEKVKTSKLFQLTSVESEVLTAYLMRTAFHEVREAGGTIQYLKEQYTTQYEIEEMILSELIFRGVLPALI